MWKRSVNCLLEERMISIFSMWLHSNRGILICRLFVTEMWIPTNTTTENETRHGL